MSGGHDCMKPQMDDIAKMLAATTHLGSENSEKNMEQYIYKRKQDGGNIINLRKTWEKMMLAARCIAAIENPADVFVISSRTFAQRAVLKFARYTGATPIAGRFTPGAFTNQIQAAFREPRILVIADPRADHQPITEASYANIPVIAFCNVDSPSAFIDLAIPCNLKSMNSIGLMWWFLAREVLRLRGSISRELPWDVMPDLFFFRDPEEAEKEEQARQESLAAQAQAPAAAKPAEEDWGGEMTNDWANEPIPAAQAPVAPVVAPAAPIKSFPASDDWNQSDWAAETAPVPAPADQSNQWGGSTNWN